MVRLLRRPVRKRSGPYSYSPGAHTGLAADEDITMKQTLVPVAGRGHHDCQHSDDYSVCRFVHSCHLTPSVTEITPIHTQLQIDYIR